MGVGPHCVVCFDVHISEDDDDDDGGGDGGDTEL